MKLPLPASELNDAMKSLRQFIGRAVLFSVFTNLLVLAPTLYMLEVYGRVVNSRNADTLLMLTILVIALFVLMEFLDWVRGYLLHAASVRLDRQLGERVFNATVEARLRNLPVGIGPLNDLRSIRNFLASASSTAVMDAPIALLFIVIIFAMNVPLGALVLTAGIIMGAIGYYTERKTKPPFTEAKKLASEAQRNATMTLKNAQVIEAMGMMDDIRGRWRSGQGKFLKQQAIASDRSGDGAAMSKFIQIAQSSMVLGFACWLILIGELNPNGNVMIVAWILSSRALGPLQQLIAQWKSIVDVRDAYARLDGLLSAIPARAQGMPLPPPKGAVTVEAVTVAAPGTQAVILRNVSFAVAPGQALAVVGPSASGKSTLARVLVGLWPAAVGKVRLDGVDLFAWNKQELGPHIGYLPQTNELFDGTLAENIARFGDIDRAKVEAAARAVGLEEVIATLPEGYDTPIGTGGGILSGGMRQRVALARAIYGDPQLIVLDEPNSSLDEAGERALVETLMAQKARGATLVVITHRVSVLPAVDRMLVLFDGQVQLFGPRDEVLKALAERAKPQPAAVPALATS